MKLQTNTFYNVYEVKRNKEGKIVDLIFDKSIDTTRKQSKSFINNLNDSKTIIDLDEIKTYYYDSKKYGRIEKATFIDYEIIKKPTYIIFDRVLDIVREFDDFECFQFKASQLIDCDYWGDEKVIFNWYNNDTILSIRQK